MPRKPTGNPNGRPKKEVNKEEFERMCFIQCTCDEVCGVLNIDDETLARWIRETYGSRETFSSVFKKYSQNGKMSLRRAMFKNAIEGKNTTMQIWLSKQHLGMHEPVVKEENELEIENVSETEKEIYD